MAWRRGEVTSYSRNVAGTTNAPDVSLPLFRFDEAGEDLWLLPLAARRALDHSGLRLSRSGWQSLPVQQRRAIVGLGAREQVDVDAVQKRVVGATPPAEPCAVLPDPGAEAVPEVVHSRLDKERPLGVAQWSALAALARYALYKIATSQRPERTLEAYDELVGASALSTHLSARGELRMVGVAVKPATARQAIAESAVVVGAPAMAQLTREDAKKGDVLAAARLAGIQAAKRTWELIPLCHMVSLTRVAVDLTLDVQRSAVLIRATAEAVDRTGVEMEALTAASVSALTIYDMLKATDRSMEIGPTRLVSKSGGSSGDFQR